MQAPELQDEVTPQPPLVSALSGPRSSERTTLDQLISDLSHLFSEHTFPAGTVMAHQVGTAAAARQL